MSALPNNIKLKIGCDGVSDLKFHPSKDTLVIGTVGGRVRIYDCSYEEPQELFRKRWHKNLTKLAISRLGTEIVSSSSQGGIKVHDFETGKGSWECLEAHDDSVSSLIWQTDNMFISGDECGAVKMWDTRQKDSVCVIDMYSEDEDLEDLGGVNDLLLDSNKRHLFAAMDNGILVTINMRKRKVEVTSESLSYGVMGVQSFKDQTKLAVATDEGVISIFNWGQFGNLSDRFPVTTIDDPIEKMCKINENVMIMSTASGRIKAASLLPNLVLSDVGKHSFKNVKDECGDCMTIGVNSDSTFVVSGCPESDVVCFYSPDVVLAECEIEKKERSKNKRKKDRTVNKDHKKRTKYENGGFFDGFCNEEKDEGKKARDSDTSSDDDADDSD